ncbi:uncharacterized protein LTR77_010826 [Saxophila tyrrhenica]|uniref:RecA family profile 1 domain-containing protein n=1 Tax=Saxophila tyrrhenica TaxID=1690608 RepID=A0AAV9NWX2_9PEZI|nr:hypothetical protein LTR77_010826 [Saxophila tyrrhenica]
MDDPSVVDLTLSQPTPKTSHRLPTVSASQALQDLTDGPSNFIKTGIASLDSRLAGASITVEGGFERGKVTEIWGPSGGGKTAIALQAAIHGIHGGSSVLWLDAAASLSKDRLRGVARVKEISSPTPSIGRDTTNHFHHVDVPTLSHLLAMILHPRADTIPLGASLLAIDGLNHLLDLDYPRYQIAAPNKTELQKWQAGRRYAILGFLVSGLNKLAVLNNIAVVVTTGCATRMRHDNGLGAALVPGLGGVEWESGISSRIVVFRDFGVRLVGVQKCQGRSLISREEVGEPGHLVAFEITSEGAVTEWMMQKADGSPLKQAVKARASPVKPRKRTADEIADSEGEDMDEYGWADTDDDAFTAEGLVGNGDASAVPAEPG